MKELRFKIFPLFISIKEPSIRNFEGLERLKLLEISQTRFSYSSQRWLRVLPSSPPKIFEQQFLPLQTTYRWKENLTASRIHLKNWDNILISQLSCNFHAIFIKWYCNGSRMAIRKNVELLKYEHSVWRFRIYNYFRENMSKNRFHQTSWSAHKISKFEYFEKVIIY